MDINKIYEGNALKLLRGMADQSVNCIVTSPPYWGLRDYGHGEQLGAEPTPELYVKNMAKIFKECYRVLKNDGTLWLNLGDTYVGGKGMNGASATHQNAGQRINKKALITTSPGKIRPNDRKHPYLKAKDLVGVPWRVAFALQKSGWYLRQDIIWAKPNPMPESICDRCTKAHEYIFLMTKEAKYYYDAAAIKTPMVPGKSNGAMKAVRASGNKNRIPGSERGCPDGNSSNVAAGVPWEGDMANKRSVWQITTLPFSEAHFATFPEKLIVDCIKAGTKAGDVVLDPFMGAGTTALVARKLGRNYIGIELNPDYIKIANTRLSKELGMFI